MNRTHRRKLDKEMRRLVMAERCSICKKPLTNGAQTWGGIARSGATAYVSDCCLPLMKVIDSYGIFATYAGLTMAERKDPEFFVSLKGGKNLEPLREAMLAADRDMIAALNRAGGLDPTAERKIFTNSSPWREDDARWFALHPDRSHRVRDLFPGEEVELEIAARYEKVDPPLRKIIIRQIEPGYRTRLPLGVSRLCDDKIDDDTLNLSWLIAIGEMIDRSESEEAVAHALFDMVKDGKPVSVDDMMEMISRYETSRVM